MDLKSLLNKEQYEGATTIDGQVLILAGAGSGKTRVLTYRMAHMIEDLDIPPYSILAITFTNKAAKEMKDRVAQLVGSKAEHMWISTFHSTCVRILRREIDKLGYKSNFTIYDSQDQKTLINDCIKTLDINDKEITYKEIAGKIGRAKDKMQTAESYKRENEYNYRENKIADVYLMYQKKLKQNNAMDFDDLICKTVELFKKNPDVLEFYQRKFRYIMVDEYQDTNGAQYELVKLLAQKYKNVCVVGDDDQCLIEGTLINTDKGYKRIEELTKADKIISAKGYGETIVNGIADISKKKYQGSIIEVKTSSGKVIKGTPGHITFADVKVRENYYYVYLMYKNKLGYRIGQTSSVRSRKGKLASGIEVRLNGEQADKIWIIKVCDTKSEANYYEEYFSVKYGLPKCVFTKRGRNIHITQELINKMFKEIDTFSNAERLMDEQYLYKEYPHSMSNAVIRGESVRKRINITFFGGKDSKNGVYSHRVGLNSSGDETKNKLIDAGFNVRNGQRNTFRIETERAKYDDAEEFAKKILLETEGFEISKKARIVKEKSLRFMPLGSLKKGMEIAVLNDNKIYLEEIISVNEIEYSGEVYDLNIDESRNYIADNIVVHNCIYAWRGADVTNILDFEKDYPSAKVIKLEQNYRSKDNILQAANTVIANNSNRKRKALRTEQEAGNKIKIYRAFDDRTEGEFVANTIANIKHKEGRKNSDFAILYRTNAQSRIFEDELRRKTIPYKIIGGTRFYDRKEIKDVLAYLKTLLNPADDVSLRRIINVPKRSIGDATIDKVQQFADEFNMSLWDALMEVRNITSLTARNITSIEKFTKIMEELMDLSLSVSPSILIETVLKDSGYLKDLENSKNVEDRSRVENIKELVTDAVEFEKTMEDATLSDYLEKVSLVQDTDKLENDEDGEGQVVLMTVHSAKGLEFPIVFMVGMENGLFPSNTDIDNESQMEEARRLCYVAITRAKEELYLTSAEMRRVFGRTVCYSQSDFISEIKPELREYINIRTGVDPKETMSYKRREALNNPHSLRASMNRTVSSSGLTANEGVNRFTAGPQNEEQENILTESNVQIGKKVRHSKFGVGTIVSITPSGSDKKLTIAFDKQGVKTFLMSLARLELV